MQSEFEDVIQQVKSNDSVKAAVLISKKPGSFIAGADIKYNLLVLILLFI